MWTNYSEYFNVWYFFSSLKSDILYIDFINFQKEYSDPSILPTPLYFYGPEVDKEYSLKIDEGKSLIVRYLTRGETKPDGHCSVFFELNGQPRTIEILDRSFAKSSQTKIKADPNKQNQVGSPLPGQVSQIFIKNGNKVIKGDKVLIIEAMKMETLVSAERSGTINNMQVVSGDNIDSKDLLFEIN